MNHLFLDNSYHSVLVSQSCLWLGCSLYFLFCPVWLVNSVFGNCHISGGWGILASCLWKPLCSSAHTAHTCEPCSFGAMHCLCISLLIAIPTGLPSGICPEFDCRRGQSHLGKRRKRKQRKENPPRIDNRPNRHFNIFARQHIYM